MFWLFFKPFLAPIFKPKLKYILVIVFAIHIIVNCSFFFPNLSLTEENEDNLKGANITHSIISIVALIVVFTSFYYADVNIFKDGYGFISVPMLLHSIVSVATFISSFLEDTNQKLLSTVYPLISTVTLVFCTVITCLSDDTRTSLAKPKSAASEDVKAEGTSSEKVKPTENPVAAAKKFGKRQRRRNPPKRRKKKY